MAGNALEKEKQLQEAIAAFNAGEVPGSSKALQCAPDDFAGSHLRQEIQQDLEAAFAATDAERGVCSGEESVHLAAWGWPMTFSEMEVLATEILRAKEDTKPLGKN